MTPCSGMLAACALLVIGRAPTEFEFVLHRAEISIKWGITLDKSNAVSSVLADSPAAIAGIVAGDKIVAVGNSTCDAPGSAVSETKAAGDSLELRVKLVRPASRIASVIDATAEGMAAAGRLTNEYYEYAANSTSSLADSTIPQSLYQLGDVAIAATNITITIASHARNVLLIIGETETRTCASVQSFDGTICVLAAVPIVLLKLAAALGALYVLTKWPLREIIATLLVAAAAFALWHTGTGLRLLVTYLAHPGKFLLACLVVRITLPCSCNLLAPHRRSASAPPPAVEAMREQLHAEVVQPLHQLAAELAAIKIAISQLDSNLGRFNRKSGEESVEGAKPVELVNLDADRVPAAPT